MNEFRNKILGRGGSPASLLRAKAAKGQPSRAAEEESFDALTIPRDTGRGAANHRDDDRHRLSSETVVICRDGLEETVTLINLSGGGAMVEGAPELKLWDRVELKFGDLHRLEAVVRWIKNGRVGLEFAHETRIEASEEEVSSLLRDVIQRSFSDVVLADAVPNDATQADDTPQDGGPDQVVRELRHPLIWNGTVHFSYESTPVRLRNISSGGAMIESDGAFPVDVELLLDLGDAGAIFGTVHWARGDQAGLKFATPYDLSQLAKARPQVTGAQWTPPDYLREDRSANSPWASQWGRADLGRLHRFLKR